MKNCFIHNKNGDYLYDFIYTDRSRLDFKFRTTKEILDARMYEPEEAEQIVSKLIGFQVSKTYRIDKISKK